MDRSENMRAIRSKDTQPEMAVRSLVHKLGYRFRLHRSDLPGKPANLSFPARRKVIFVHGCFWHSHGCKPGLTPKSNQDFWLPKLRQNKVRDRKSLKALSGLGLGFPGNLAVRTKRRPFIASKNNGISRQKGRADKSEPMREAY